MNEGPTVYQDQETVYRDRTACRGQVDVRAWAKDAGQNEVNTMIQRDGWMDGTHNRTSVCLDSNLCSLFPKSRSYDDTIFLFLFHFLSLPSSLYVLSSPENQRGRAKIKVERTKR
jgi:hypothetical protein